MTDPLHYTRVDGGGAAERPGGSRGDERRVLEGLERLQVGIRAARGESASQRELVASHPPPPASTRLEARMPDPPVRPHLSEDVPVAGAVKPGRRAAQLLGGLAATLAIAALAWLWLADHSRTPAPPVATLATPEPVPAAPAPSSEPAPAPVDPHALRVDLTTLRPVWLRVAVDGRIAIEREVAAGEQLPFGADRTIVVRAGDGGAVTLRVGGEEQGPMGRDGLPLTRSFAAPAR